MKKTVAALKNNLEEIKRKREKKSQQQNVMAELPDFTNQLVLLLNAGLVLTTAIEKIANEDRNSYFYREIRAIYDRMKGVNSTFEIEFRDFARRCSVRELLRLSNIITDNINKGTELVSKLEQESALMWHMSKKSVEEKGKIAESKMTFPMAVMLISIILVTSAPAFMTF